MASDYCLDGIGKNVDVQLHLIVVLVDFITAMDRLVKTVSVSSSNSSSRWWIERMFSKASCIVVGVAYVCNRYGMGSGQQVTPLWRDPPLRFVRNWVLAMSGRND